MAYTFCLRPLGTLWNTYSTRRYQMPVMDSIFVRKNQRGQGFGVKMLQDYVLSFKENSLGLRYPLPTSMYKGTSVQIADKYQSLVLFSYIPYYNKYMHLCKHNGAISNPSVQKVPMSVSWRQKSAVGGRECR